MSQLIVKDLVDAVSGCLPTSESKPISLHEPRFGASERDYVLDCVNTHWVSSVGAYVDQFERQLTEYTGAKYAIAVVNGTAALHLSLVLSGVEYGDEVLVPALTFVATANAVAHCGAIPHFVDSDFASLGLDVAKLRDYLSQVAIYENGSCVNKLTGRRIRAVVPMHTFGHPVNLDDLAELCNDFGIVLVEDAAESLGSFYKGKHTGTFGLVSALSFNGNKIVTTGGGGAILTNSEELAVRAKHLSTTAKLSHAWEYVHDEIGYNYRLPNLNAALGVAQMERLSGLVRKKRVLAERYQRAFDGLAGVEFVLEPERCTSNYWLNAILLTDENSSFRDEVLRATHEAGFLTRPAWTLLHKLPMYRDCPRMDLPKAESIERRLVNLPSSPWLVDDDE